MLTGLFLILNSSLSLTGFVIFESRGRAIFNFLGAVFIVLGIILFNYKPSLEVVVYDATHGKSKREARGHNYRITDPNFYFGQKGTEGISLSDFRKEVEDLRRSPDGQELIGIVRETYGPQLEKAIKSGEPEKARVAREFLAVLYNREYARNLGRERRELSKQEAEEIRNAFKDWEGRPNVKQARILRAYGFVYEPGKSHPHIRSSEYHDLFVSVSSTPSDIHAGDNAAKDVINLIERAYERKFRENTGEENEESEED